MPLCEVPAGEREDEDDKEEDDEKGGRTGSKGMDVLVCFTICSTARSGSLVCTGSHAACAVG